MTKEQILAMEAGRELSGLVAVEVMGRNCAHVNLVPLNPNSIQHSNGAKSRCLGCGYRDYNSFLRNSFLHCSTNIFDAWQVMERMLADGYGVLMVGAEGKWTVVFSGDLNYKQEGETVQEAICKAALLAKLGA